FVGVGLSATCGFRVFVPLLGLGIANHLGHVPLSGGFDQPRLHKRSRALQKVHGAPQPPCGAG
ncbi:MAG: DUF4126 domain-containing protein, partial [Candidatus Krumholzibacteria bacterium]|nr:DUF4126 domain-containing protein [Candidatus Krumholzibacteria bacterium]